MIEYLFSLIDNGIPETEAIKKTVSKYHKYEVFGKDINESVKILSEMYFGTERDK